ncbi:MAG: hypothetical protein P9L92_10925 [Candidatus Electryonea clarkiae]|nr:hypothetical protein [Candidatus Electryonea clarkiae]
MKTSFKVTVLFLAVLFLIPVTLFAQIEFTRHVVGTNFAGVHRAYPVDIDGDGDICDRSGLFCRRYWLVGK